MAKFFVGQRVRILFSLGWPELAGSEGVIVSEAGCSGIHGRSQWLVAPKEWGTHEATREGDAGGWSFGPNEDQLEPILPEGSAPSEFTFQRLMDSLQEISAGVGIPSNSAVEASGFLALVRTGDEFHEAHS